jgi:glycosyltransferase involved in cell wall biosynthesis
MTAPLRNAWVERDRGVENISKERRRKRRRICMVVHSSYPMDARVRREAGAAVSAGHSVDVICLHDPGQARSEIIDGVTVRRLPIRHVPGGGPRRMLYEYLVFATLATLALGPASVTRRYDVIHVHNPPDFLIVTGVLPRLCGSRLMLDVHDLSSHMFRSRFPGRVGHLAGRVLDLIERCAGRFAHVVLTVHEPYRRELIAHGVPAEKLAVVMNAADEVLCSAVDSRHGRPKSDAFVVGYSGTIAPWYGVNLIVDALEEIARELPHAKALILGGGDALDAVRAHAGATGVADRVEFSGGWLPAEQGLARLSRASCGVIPNLPTELNRFALSTKLFEYIALGLPAVVARLETLQDHFSEQEVTFFTPGDPASLAEALRWVATHPLDASAKARRARARVALQYSWSRNRDQYLAAVESGNGMNRSGRSAASMSTDWTTPRGGWKAYRAL